MVFSMPIIEFSNVSFSFSKQKPLFKNLSLKFTTGKFYLVTGPSGAGKSTLLRLINRLEDPTDGHIRFDGRRLSTYSPYELRRSIQYVQQTPTVIENTVRQNLMLGFSFRNNRDLPLPNESALQNQLDSFLLHDISLDANAQTLSVGQLQRMCFIRGLLLQPRVLLLDEPTSALDEKNSRIVEDTVERLCLDSGLTVLMISHRKFKPKQIDCCYIRIADGRVEPSIQAQQ
jgi:putative ABC transport system ATP-binding protein